MTLRQTIQAAPAKTAELIAKLAATSNQAVKTRETLFAQLGDELARYVEVEEAHLLPLLRKHPQTKDLAVEALKGNKDLRASLAKLSALPKDSDEFLGQLAEMNKGFQQHVRNERKELLPAVLDALSAAEATALAASIEGAAAEAEKARRDEAAQARRQAEEAEQAAAAAEKAKRDEAREVAAQAKRQAEEAETAAAAERAAERATARAQKAAEQSAREATERTVDAVERGAAAMQDGARQVAEDLTERGRQVATNAREAMTVYSASAQSIVEDLQAVRTSSAVSMKAMSEVQSAWMEWFGKAARLNADASWQMARCRRVKQMAELQQEYAITAMRHWMEGSARVLGVTQLASKQALRPLDERLSVPV